MSMLVSGCTVVMSMLVSSRRAEAPRCAHFTTVISPSWIAEQISVGKCVHPGASAHREHQTSFKIVTWTKQTWKKHKNTVLTLLSSLFTFVSLLSSVYPPSLVVCCSPYSFKSAVFKKFSWLSQYLSGKILIGTRNFRRKKKLPLKIQHLIN